ncbi:Aste57867_13691 [Aphanomyces stellatus]|uniref:Aste57867_13691 protein n=1 Tax=Aphanomyces stellatus TaxID=120398 RepID=A0A485KYQ2_9STRA|nr:hypothetical protein As57867_013641 [Aphanomyces stellatus]VFT90524.1 Aste57867_13691 [Aphanomyces stellatus]
MSSAYVIDNLIGAYDQRNATAWRRDDLLYRDQTCQWRVDEIKRDYEWRIQDIRRIKIQAKLENERRQTDARCEQLSTVASLGAILGGFAMVSAVNVNIPDSGVDDNVVALYGLVSALTMCVMTVAAAIFSLLLTAVTRYSAQDLDADVRCLHDDHIDIRSPFHVWWLKKCESDWQLGYRLFRLGVLCFLAELGVVSWVQFYHWQATSMSISAIALVGIFVWQFRVLAKWRYLVHEPAPSTPTHATRTIHLRPLAKL